MEVKQLSLADPQRKILIIIAAVALADRDAFHPAIHLVGRGIENNRLFTGKADAFQDIERPQGIDLEILAWIGHGSCNRHLRRKMDHGPGVGMTPEDVPHRIGIPDIEFLMSIAA